MIEIFSYSRSKRTTSAETNGSAGKPSVCTTPMNEKKADYFEQNENEEINGRFSIAASELKDSAFIEENPKIFNLLELMLCLCLDETPMSALRKAFLVFEDEQKTVSKLDIETIFQHFLTPISCGDRTKEIQGFMNPFPSYRLNTILATNEKRVTFEAFVDLTEKNELGDWLQCPLYSLEV